MQEFLQLFGDKSIGWAVMVIGAAVFLKACYKEIEKYFSDKAIREKEKDERLEQKLDEVKRALNELRIESSESKASGNLSAHCRKIQFIAICMCSADDSGVRIWL